MPWFDTSDPLHTQGGDTKFQVLEAHKKFSAKSITQIRVCKQRKYVTMS